MHDKIHYDKACQHCQVVTIQTESDSGRRCLKCGKDQSLDNSLRISPFVNQVIDPLIWKFGFRQGLPVTNFHHGSPLTHEAEIRFKQSVMEYCLRMEREGNEGCIVRWFGIQYPLRSYPVLFRGKPYNKNFMKSRVPPIIHECALFLTEQFSFGVAEKRLDESPMFLRFEKHDEIFRNQLIIEVLVRRIELNWKQAPVPPEPRA